VKKLMQKEVPQQLKVIILMPKVQILMRLVNSLMQKVQAQKPQDQIHMLKVQILRL
jgi:hypothetical protein